MQLMQKIFIISLILLLIVPKAYSTTCYRSESYCSEFGTIQFNCRNVNYNPYGCRVYGEYTYYQSKTCSRTVYNQKCDIIQEYNCEGYN